jgi:hypothetical protein
MGVYYHDVNYVVKDCRLKGNMGIRIFCHR